MCAELPPSHKLQHALDRMGIAYHSFCLESGSEEKADQSRAIWSGICLWLARRLGPIPSPLLETDAFDGLLQVLGKGNWPLGQTCAYFRLSMVRLPPLLFQRLRANNEPEAPFSLLRSRDGLWTTLKDRLFHMRECVTSSTRKSLNRVMATTGGMCVPPSRCPGPNMHIQPNL